MSEVSSFGLGCRVKVNIDDVIQHANCRANGLRDGGSIKPVFADEFDEINRTEVADCGLLWRCVEQDLCAEIRAVNHSNVILWRTEIRWILKCDPRMSRLEQHAQHLAPETYRLNLLVKLELSTLSLVLVLNVTLLELLTVKVVKVRHITWAEERPASVGGDTLHEQVWDPVSRIHVMCTTTLVTGVFSELEEILDIQVPRLKVRAHRALTLTALVNGNRGVVSDLEERNNSLAASVGSLDSGAGGANVRPVVSKSAGPLRKLRVVSNTLEDVLKIVGDRGEVARTQLRVQRSSVKEGRRT